MFSENTIKFLFENCLNNSREYFNSHRAEYDSCVLNPFKEFVIALSDTAQKIDEKIVAEPKVNKTISRINRDTRFSKDKTLYRDHIWISFRRDKKAFEHYPEIFFSISPDDYCFGCGYWMMIPDSQKKYRELILNNDPTAIKAINALKKIDGAEMQGDKLKRNKYLDQSPDKQLWLNVKNPAVMITSTDTDILFSEKIVDECKLHFEQFEPIYDFFVNVEKLSRN